MKPANRHLPAQRLLRVAQWGQVFALGGQEGGAAQIIEELAVGTEQSDAVVALADRWQALDHPSLGAITAVLRQPLAPGQSAVRIVRSAPRGSLLAEIGPKMRAADERMTAALLLDLARALALCHARGLVAGSVAPQNLVLCPPGLDDLPPLRLCEAGLPSLVLAAAGQPIDGQHPMFAQVFACIEVAAPELLLGHEPAPASDTYALAATAAWLLLRHHVHEAASPGLIAHQAAQGLSQAQEQALQDVAPTLGPVLCKALAVHAWARAGALADFIVACATLTDGAPTFRHGSDELLAPWGMRSPLIPLAAFATALPYAEHFLPRPSGGDRLIDARVAGGQDADTEARLGRIAPADQARLRAALQRLEVERIASQQRSDQQERTSLGKILALVLVLLACAAIALLGTRRAQRIAQMNEPATTASPKRAAPRTFPKPRILLRIPEDKP